MIDIFFDRFRTEAHLLLAACCKETWVAQLLPSLSVHISEFGGQKVNAHDQIMVMVLMMGMRATWSRYFLSLVEPWKEYLSFI